jgi:adenylate cyclase
MSRCPDLDTLVSATVEGLAEVFGYEHSLLLLLDEAGTTLYTIASRGYDAQGVGSEVAVGDGIIGLAAEKCVPIRVGGVHQFARYSRRVRRSFEDSGDIGAGREIPLPGLKRVASVVAVPAMVLGELVGVLVVESEETVAFGRGDEAQLMVIASLVANAIEVERARERATEPKPSSSVRTGPSLRVKEASGIPVRYYAVDGSTFIDGDYLIKGVAGRLLWSLLMHYDRDGRTDFTNREIRLDPTLELPEFRDNFESRLILLKRRLDERAAPIRIDKTGRGRFRLVVNAPLRLELAGE